MTLTVLHELLLHKTYAHKGLQYSHRQAIAIVGKLTHGVTTQHIIDSIRNSFQEKFEWTHYTTKKDINNIEDDNYTDTQHILGNPGILRTEGNLSLEQPNLCLKDLH